ncbi:MAG: cell division protein FtsZ [Vicingaceae bacterium]|nr:cell division protein FtsZ [Vicingaceae bacterium]
MKFDLPKDQASIIKVIGVGGGGSNAVNHMYNQGITGVDFMICNTDAQALEQSPIPNKIQLGTTLTEGLGAGANPEVGKNAAIEDVEAIKTVLQNNTKMVFITAGMGGGTGTGAAPIIAETAREMGILTVGIVTIPFSFEGRRRKQQADEGLEALRASVDTLLIINNDKLRMMYGNLRMGEAFSKADDILTVAAKGISEIITVTGYVNTDFRDVQTVMRDGGTAIMGSGSAEGENRAIDAVTKALASPLLNDNEIKGANYILLNITSGLEEITMDEIGDITDFIQEEAGLTADVIWGNCTDESLGDKVSVTVIATGFGANSTDSFTLGQKPEKVVMALDADVPTSITTSLDEVEKTVEPSNEITEPTLKTEITEQPTLNFETPAEEVQDVVEDTYEAPVSIKEEVEKVIFNLEDDVEDEAPEAEVSDFVVNTINDEVEETVDAQLTEEVSDEFEAPTDELVEPETTSFNWSDASKIEEDEVEEPAAEITEEPVAEERTIVWSLNENDTVDEVENETEEFTAELEEESEQKITFVQKEETPENKEEEGPVYTNRIPDEEQMKRSQERIMKIKELGLRMKTPSGINDLENEPAYKRRKINLDETPHSSENPISRFTLSNDEEGKPRLNDDNSFLHDNVD